MSKNPERQSDPARLRLADIEKQCGPPIAAAAVVASALLWLPQAYLVSDFLGALVQNREAKLGLLATVALFIVLGFLRHAGDGLAGRLAFRTGQRVVERQRTVLIERQSLSSPFGGHRQTSAGIATLIGNKLDALMPWLTRYRLSSMKVAVVPLVILTVVATLSWVAGAILLVAGPLIPVFMALIGLAARAASEKQMAETGSLNVMLLEWLNAATDIRLLDAGPATLERFREAAEALRARTMEVLKIAFLSSTVLELFAAIGIAMVAVYVGFSLLGTFTFGAYETPLTVAEGIFILLLAPDFFQPLRDLAAAWHDKASALAVAGELAELERVPHAAIVGSGGKASPLGLPLTITTKDLVHAAEGGPATYYPDFTIGPGERVAITGPSGAGKTTLIALLAGLARPIGGTVEVCGRPLDDRSADGWRSQIAYVGQQPHMLNASLRANVALVEDRADPARLAEALRSAAAEELVAGLARGVDTRLGENGSGVSGGEARRLTIARAFYAGAQLIFADEPTADLDAATAEKVIKALEAIGNRGATLVVATHDPRLVARMDREIRLEPHP